VCVCVCVCVYLYIYIYIYIYMRLSILYVKHVQCVSVKLFYSNITL